VPVPVPVPVSVPVPVPVPVPAGGIASRCEVHTYTHAHTRARGVVFSLTQACLCRWDALAGDLSMCAPERNRAGTLVESARAHAVGTTRLCSHFHVHACFFRRDALAACVFAGAC
jgi:hypothetical protein